METDMTIKELQEKLNLKTLVDGGEPDRAVTDCYVGDLLSWVMGRAPEDSVWLTVMGNINSIAVATLAVLVEDAALDEEARNKAEMHGVTIFGTDKNSYQLAVEISKLI